MKVNFFVFGSNIASWRSLLSIGNDLGIGIVRALPAERRRAGRVIGPGHPDPALGIEHVVVIVEPRVPDLLHAPIGRSRHRLLDRGMARPERLGHTRPLRRRDVGDLRRSSDRAPAGDRSHIRSSRTAAVGIDRRIALVGRDQVVKIFLVVAPIPGRDHDIALDALRPRRLGARQLALGDAIGPVAEIFERHAAEFAGEQIDHQSAPPGRTGCAAPRLLRRS